MGFCVARTIPIPYARACLSSINMGAFDGGFPAAGKKPKISSIYRIVLSDDVPVCLRIQLRYRLRKRVIKNILWASLRCTIERIDTLGFPVSVYRSFLISRDSPCVQSSNPGLARTLLSNIASLRRSSIPPIFLRIVFVFNSYASKSTKVIVVIRSWQVKKKCVIVLIIVDNLVFNRIRRVIA